jgi:Xaa-Pro aminopeptidase
MKNITGSSRALHDGELVIFDVGTELDHYVSDVGRTFPVSGKFTEGQRRILEMEISVVEAILDAVKPGVTLRELTAIAQSKIPPQEREYMQTGSYYGHHIGLSTGDPALMDIPLAPGMIFTVEPWYYNHDKEIAVFTEEVVVVTDEGARVLTTGLPRSPVELEKLVGAK